MNIADSSANRSLELIIFCTSANILQVICHASKTAIGIMPLINACPCSLFLPALPTFPDPSTKSIQPIQMLQPRQHDLLARLLNLARQKYLVQNSVHLVKIKHQVQLTHVAEECVQHLDEEMYGFKVGELVVVCVDAGAEEEARVATVDYL
jgi:hypothetical protein